MPSRTIRRVALLIESSRAYGRGLLRGIARYARTHGHWSLRHQELSLSSAPPPWLQDWDGDGILVHIETRKMAEVIRALEVPTADLCCSRRIPGIPRINTDNQQVVRLALDHLRDRGFRRFAYCGFKGIDYSVQRLTCYLDYVGRLGAVPNVYESPTRRRTQTTGAELSGMLDETGVARWLAGLEKPIGLLACNDIRAQQVLEACKRSGIAVPDEIAVIGVDNDDVICSLCGPPLSSVELDTQRIGYESASILERMMDGQECPEQTIVVPPKGVITRRSTDVLAVEDRIVAEAYRFIREHACDGITVGDVLSVVPLSRRSLERRLRKHFGRAPRELIAGFKLHRVKQLLRETDFTLQRIAVMTGFNHVEHMGVFFKNSVGLAPGEYRTRQRK